MTGMHEGMQVQDSDAVKWYKKANWYRKSMNEGKSKDNISIQWRKVNDRCFVWGDSDKNIFHRWTYVESLEGVITKNLLSWEKFYVNEMLRVMVFFSSVLFFVQEIWKWW